MDWTYLLQNYSSPLPASLRADQPCRDGLRMLLAAVIEDDQRLSGDAQQELRGNRTGRVDDPCSDESLAGRRRKVRQTSLSSPMSQVSAGRMRRPGFEPGDSFETRT